MSDQCPTLNGDKCLVCGGPPIVLGVFFPDKPQDWPRKRTYWLCKTCFALPEQQRSDAVEMRIMMQGRNN